MGTSRNLITSAPLRTDASGFTNNSETSLLGAMVYWAGGGGGAVAFSAGAGFTLAGATRASEITSFAIGVGACAATSSTTEAKGASFFSMAGTGEGGGGGGGGVDDVEEVEEIDFDDDDVTEVDDVTVEDTGGRGAAAVVAVAVVDFDEYTEVDIGLDEPEDDSLTSSFSAPLSIALLLLVDTFTLSVFSVFSEVFTLCTGERVGVSSLFFTCATTLFLLLLLLLLSLLLLLMMIGLVAVVELVSTPALRENVLALLLALSVADADADDCASSLFFGLASVSTFLIASLLVVVLLSELLLTILALPPVLVLTSLATTAGVLLTLLSLSLLLLVLVLVLVLVLALGALFLVTAASVVLTILSSSKGLPKSFSPF